MEVVKIPEFKTADKNHNNPYFRYSTFSIEMMKTDKYPHMVEITRGPKWARSILGKRYVAPHYAMIAIDTIRMERMIDNSKSKVLKELEEQGYDVDAALDAIDNSGFTEYI